MAEIKFSRTDCWIFLSIPNSEAGGDLEKVLEIADAINNSIPERRQIEDSINKGLQNQIIFIDKGKFVLTPKFQQFIKGAFKKNGSPISLIEILYNKMLSWCEQPMECKAFKLTDDNFENAHIAYLKSFSEAYKKL
jgi:hypothetical protein